VQGGSSSSTCGDEVVVEGAGQRPLGDELLGQVLDLLALADRERADESPFAAVAGEQSGVERSVRRQLALRVEALLPETGVRLEFAGVVGRPADEIVDVAERQNADLIVVGTREPGFFERLLGGSVSTGVA